MISTFSYIPIIKAYQGELLGIANVDKSVKKRLLPFFEVPPIKEKQKTPEGLEKHLFKLEKKIRLAWGIDSPFLLDLFYIPPNLRVRENEHPVSYIFNELQHLKAIPVIGLNSIDEPLENAIKGVVKKFKRGVCIRLQRDDCIIVDELEFKILSLLEKLNVPSSQTHLILDYKIIHKNEVDSLADTTIRTINQFQNINKYQSLTVMGSGFPDKLFKIKPNEDQLFSRTEFELWEILFNRKKELERLPTFGDYGIVYPIPKLLSFGSNFSGKIRLTRKKDWRVFRGQSFKKHPLGRKQYYELSQKVVSKENKSLSNLCWGDNKYKMCAKQNFLSESLSNWVGYDTNHHLTFVTNQLSTYSGF